MNKESYVKAVAKRLTCSKARQAEFVRDLESDIAAALSAGETWEQVESRMGDPRQVAQEFNEDLSEAERAAGKKRKRTKTIAIVATVAVAVAAIIGAATWWASPENRPCGAKLPPNRAAGNRACAGGGRAARRGRLRNAAVDVDRRNESGSQRRDDGASEGDHGSR